MDAENRSFAFNGDNKQKEIRDSNNNLVGEYFYDGEGKRVKKKAYQNGILDEETVFVYSGGKLIAEYSNKPPAQNPTTSWTVTDQLGSPRVLVNTMGEVVSRRDFLPFGEEIIPEAANLRTNATLKYNGDGVRQKFTGYQKDEESGLDFAEARMYENRHGRFTAVDPLLASGKSGNPQTFNRYVYVLNNPLIFTDPEGLQAGTKPQGAWYVPVNPPTDRVWRAEWIKHDDPLKEGMRQKTYYELVFQSADSGRWEAQNPINGETAQYDDEETALRRLNSWTGGVQGMLAQKYWERSENSSSFGGRWANGWAGFALSVGSMATAEPPPGVYLNSVPTGKSAVEGTILSASRAVGRSWTVYLGRNAAGQLYPGMTMRQIGVREAEHIATGGAKATLALRQMETASTSLAARIAEQKLINELGGKAAMESGTLLNKRNAVAPKWWDLYNIPPPK